MVESILNSSGAFDSNSSIKFFHLKSTVLSNGIFRKYEVDAFSQSLLHSLLILFKIISKTACCTLAIAITALAMDRVCPPSKLQASLLSDSPTVFVNGVVRVGVDRDIYLYI